VGLDTGVPAADKIGRRYTAGSGAMKCKSAISLVILLGLGTAGCGTTAVEAHFTLPARSRAMQERQRVVVREFEGKRGRRASAVIRSAMSLGAFHELVAEERSETSRQQLDLAAEAGDQQVLRDVTLRGATVIVEGSTEVDDYSIARRSWEEVEDVCTRQDQAGNCVATEKRTYRVYGVEERCRAGLGGRVLRVADNAVLLERLEGDQATYEDNQRGQPPEARGRVLCDEAFEVALGLFVRYLTPHAVQRALVFHKVPDDGGETERALALVKSGRFAEAIRLAEGLIELAALDDEGRAWARYNLGLLYFTQARFDECVQQMTQAQSALDDGLVQGGLVACQTYVQ
jgi:tetratricopeptide (TPR) repeat protein